MTTEQKAKAYDEAVNKLRRFMTQGVDPLITRADVQDFFPELAESEDERIRNGIIKYLSYIKDRDGSYMPNNIPFDDMLAWLEKQGECQVKESAISQHENKTCKENNDSLTSKDDMMIEETLYFLREYQQSNRCKDESGMQNSVTCEKWLKSLKERINEKQ